MSAADRSVIQVSQPVKARLDALKAEQERERKRQVSISEVIERLLEIRDGWLTEARGRA